jgi:hypothetical protein
MAVHASQAKKATTWSIIRFLLLFLFAGLVLTGLILYSIQLGILERWHFVTTVPKEMVEVMGADPYDIYLRSSQGKVFSCPGVDDPDHNQPCIPDVFKRQYQTQPCDPYNLAFLPLANPPKKITTCTETSGSIYDSSGFYLTRSALDRDGNLWAWKVNQYYHPPLSLLDLVQLIVLIVIGGFLGLLLGSIIRTVREIVRRKKEPAPLQRLPVFQVLLLVFPWFCLGSGMIFWSVNVNRPSASIDWTPNPTETYLAQTLALQGTEQSLRRWAIDATPKPGHPRYDLTQNLCAVIWKIGEKVDACRQIYQLNGSIIQLLPDPEIGGIHQRGMAIGIDFSSGVNSVSTEYAAMEIQPGDHLKTTVTCLGQANAKCDVFFSISCDSLEYPDDCSLGRWQPATAGELEEIDVDLSRFAGRKLRINLDASLPENSDTHTFAIWLAPGID